MLSRETRHNWHRLSAPSRTECIRGFWDWQEDRRKHFWHGSEKRPTMHTASMEIKAAFDVARPKHVAIILGEQAACGWITAALSREMRGLERHATFEKVDSTFGHTRCIRQGCVEVLTLWLKKKKTLQFTEIIPCPSMFHISSILLSSNLSGLVCVASRRPCILTELRMMTLSVGTRNPRNCG